MNGADGGGLGEVLAGVGPRLRAARGKRELTLAAVAAATGISVSTLSRLESGARRPALESLLPLARLYGTTLDDLVGAPAVEDPRVPQRPVTRNGTTHVPLTREAGGVQAYKLVLPARPAEPDLKVHEGYEWMYVLSGRLRLVLGEHDVELGKGEAAEFDTRVPHWFGSATNRPVELLSLFGPQGERMHVRARPTRRGG
ncbi:transcriptional regulator with XRE-family HTH domain [Kineococcus xinjiangensis]|uniref:Transcriptional regulator with XRE-family HTH domain n=1 Tax=Kineococcus xinjiangensis TaxID=512762 RepID=A0A2S6IU02_9ACTN|nr:XRE family transcriptional regulator [Kineococcus xinjiangensis]PPK97737.1 transcriptional regulator with XRE-family HTH domain [Kineococcus xinjiangensis]